MFIRQFIRHFSVGLFAVSFGFVSLVEAALADGRVALVIGNSKYRHAPALINPMNDAEDVSRKLADLGFTVIAGIDLDKRGMEGHLQKFAAALDGASVGVFFYAGHGLQVSGQNYMVPIDARLESGHSVDFELIQLSLVHRTMETATKTNLLFVDACRDNPLARNLARAMGTRSQTIGRGLAAMEAGAGTLISFSTQPGNVALDGVGARNSPYAKALVDHLDTSKQSTISDLLIRVRRDVMRSTGRRQVPWEHSALTDQFYFSKPDVGRPASAQMPSSGPTYQEQAELIFWKSVMNSRDPEILRTYISQYPNGTFVPLARKLAENLEKSAEKETLARIKEAQLKEAEKPKAPGEAVEAPAADVRKELEAAERERIAALKAAEEARLANERAVKASEEAVRKKISSLKLQADNGNDQQQGTAQAVQTALKSAGCYDGRLDGDWGAKSRGAVALFNRHAETNLEPAEPSHEMLQAIRARSGRVCPNDAGTTANKHKPPKRKERTTQPAEAAKGPRRANIVRKKPEREPERCRQYRFCLMTAHRPRIDCPEVPAGCPRGY